MVASSVGSTNPELIRRVAALWDNPAWGEFFDRYAPFVRARCSAYGLDTASVDELCQRVWFELARRMPSFQYDPRRSFRGWLVRLCHHRAIDLLRERRLHHFEALNGDALMDGQRLVEDIDAEMDEVEAASWQVRLLREALVIQEEVRRKVKPIRWEAFWRVVIDGQPVGEAAAALGLKYGTVYAGVNHVAELLCAEGRRRKAELGIEDGSDLMKG